MTTALAGYLAIGQIAQHLDLTLPDDIAAGEPVTLGIRSVRPDGRSHHDPSFRWPWPGNWTPRIDADASAAECSHGLHIALGWRGLSATGPVHVCQIVGYRAADVAHVAATKLRVSQAAVLDVWDVHRMVRDGNLRSANLVGANLSGADLSYADLRSANLRGANLRSADLRSADLRSADLRSANLRYANLRYANLYAAPTWSAPTCTAPTCTAPTCAPPTCTAPTCATPTCATPTCPAPTCAPPTTTSGRAGPGAEMLWEDAGSPCDRSSRDHPAAPRPAPCGLRPGAGQAPRREAPQGRRLVVAGGSLRCPHRRRLRRAGRRLPDGPLVAPPHDPRSLAR
jgi:hypothetical protein